MKWRDIIIQIQLLLLIKTDMKKIFLPRLRSPDQKSICPGADERTTGCRAFKFTHTGNAEKRPKVWT